MLDGALDGIRGEATCWFRKSVLENNDET
ncbi:hypothetical protein CGLO_15311 [Colletotrichum gloeosporioides Cg-14]|uniref:Uncharacterized protein n=1 Tax=Colletotrichum gloeosporioides (strain Cg-14) TaxID=1237896 RepID=T0JR95_COLGC|nr:hypothetical protein CGLO_15311 [Colletotrichum gloeosporioides Cg-14]